MRSVNLRTTMSQSAVRFLSPLASTASFVGGVSVGELPLVGPPFCAAARVWGWLAHGPGLTPVKGCDRVGGADLY
jgi:hypothetical protein